MAKKMVYQFEEGDPKNKKLLGGKGAGLCGMTKIKLPVPPGFVVTTEACNEYYANKKKLPKGLMEQVVKNLKLLEKKTKKVFGGDPPLLVSVRSGAAVSMPGMMDTILNLGLNDKTIQYLIKSTNNERFAYDAYRRFVQMLGNIALDIPREHFDKIFDGYKTKTGAKFDTDLDVNALKNIVTEYKEVIKKITGKDFPDNPVKQLELAIVAVFDSWEGKRCVDYRKQFRLTEDIVKGTATNVQTMVFGNMGNDSATGVAFTRDPGTGENIFYGEYLVNAQGEDVVAGIRTPKPIIEMKNEMPKMYKELCDVRSILEKHYGEVQDFEFTIERGKLYNLQTRNGKMNAAATIKTSVDMVKEGLLTKKEALLRVKPEHMEQLLHKRFSLEAKKEAAAKNSILGKGLPASPGAASGSAVFSADDAETLGKSGKKVILVREETKPDDIHGFFAAQGILTSRGGKTSHAAVVARGMGKPCVAGWEDIKIDNYKKEFAIGTRVVKEGDVISIDGTTGEVILGELPTIEPDITPELQQVLKWADDIRELGVRANADTPESAAKARKFGAAGIGLCRTERMFNATDRLPLVHKMILAKGDEERKKAIEALMPLQKQDFKGILKAMEGYPVTIRLLDPPLHEFLPTIEELIHEINHLKHTGDNEKLKEKEEILAKVRSLYEVNPMLGHRGVRLGITLPELYDMQAQAIIEAGAELVKEGVDARIEIMIPQVCSASELKFVKDRVKAVADKVMKYTNVKVKYSFGTMIEVVRACVTADSVAEIAEFFSFGTNDLTQATFSFSREDAENKFLPNYIAKGILPANPFETLDADGVGKLMDMAVRLGRGKNKKLKVGICGEHGGDPNSIKFCHKTGLNYVSCSTFRVPIARLAAAHVVLEEQSSKKAAHD